jgi:hypothetical protein
VAVLCVVATQVLGLMTPAQAAVQQRDGCRDVEGRAIENRALAESILDTAGAMDRDEAFRTVYVTTGFVSCHVAALPDAWVHALTGSLSTRTYGRSAWLDEGFASASDAAAPVRTALRDDPELRVLADPEVIDELRRLLGPELASRVHATDR